VGYICDSLAPDLFDTSEESGNGNGSENENESAASESVNRIGVFEMVT
jgi:hypothetical protein